MFLGEDFVTITKQDWVETAMQHKAVSASTWTDDYANQLQAIWRKLRG